MAIVSHLSAIQGPAAFSPTTRSQHGFVTGMKSTAAPIEGYDQKWFNENGNGLLEAAGQQPVQPPPQEIQKTPPVVNQVGQTPVESATEQQNPQDIYSQIGSIIGSGGGNSVQASPLRPSAFSNQPVSDAPTAARTIDKGKSGKILEIIGSIFSMGATKGMSQAGKQSSGGSDAPRQG